MRNFHWSKLNRGNKKVNQLGGQDLFLWRRAVIAIYIMFWVLCWGVQGALLWGRATAVVFVFYSNVKYISPSTLALYYYDYYYDYYYLTWWSNSHSLDGRWHVARSYKDAWPLNVCLESTSIKFSTQRSHHLQP